MPQRPFQLSPSCPGIEETALQVSGPCPHLGQCPHLTLLQTQKLSWWKRWGGRKWRRASWVATLRCSSPLGEGLGGHCSPPHSSRLPSPTF